jgi:hypothetical protein
MASHHPVPRLIDLGQHDMPATGVSLDYPDVCGHRLFAEWRAVPVLLSAGSVSGQARDVLSVTAMAMPMDAGHAAAENPVTGFFSWESLGSYTGSIAATVLILRVLSSAGIPGLTRIPIIMQAYLISLLILIGSDFALPPAPTESSITLCFVNAFGVAVAALGTNAVLGLPTKHPDDGTATRHNGEKA